MLPKDKGEKGWVPSMVKFLQSPPLFPSFLKPTLTRMRCCRHQETSQSSIQTLQQPLSSHHVALKMPFECQNFRHPPRVDPRKMLSEMHSLSFSLQNTTQHTLQFQTHTLQLHCPSLFNWNQSKPRFLSFSFLGFSPPSIAKSCAQFPWVKFLSHDSLR